MKNTLMIFIATLVVVLGLSIYNIHGSNERQEFAASQGSADISLRTEGLWNRTLVVDADPKYDSHALADLMAHEGFLADQLKALGFITVRVGNVTEAIQ